jgi:hypothetical protein
VKTLILGVSNGRKIHESTAGMSLSSTDVELGSDLKPDSVRSVRSMNGVENETNAAVCLPECYITVNITCV